ncbi:dihydrolipoyl dehydrogenase [Chloroflexota bacterium]
MENDGSVAQGKYDYLVIGSGPAGFVSSITAAQLGLKVAVVQEGIDMLGGACTNEGVIPAKSLIYDARTLNSLKRDIGLFGIEEQDIKVDMSKLVEKSRNTIIRLRKGLAGLFKKNGIDVINGHAQFTDQYTVAVTSNNGEVSSIKADKFLIASGSVPKPLLNTPFDGSRVISSSDAIRLSEVPKKMVIVGGGAIGVECASLFNILGAEVTIVEYEDSLLPFEDAEISIGLRRLFEKKGIITYTASKVTNMSPLSIGLDVTIQGESAQEIINCDNVLVSTGRVPVTSTLGLEKAGVKTDDHGFIPVDNQMRTNINNIYAAGDVIPTPMLANVAFSEGEIAAKSATGQATEMINYEAVPNVIYTEIQVASIGLTEEQAIEKKLDYSVGKQQIVGTFKSSITSDRDGFIKVIANNDTGKLLGAHILASEAAELIQGFIIAIKTGLTVQEIEKIIPPNPTFSESVIDACRLVFGKTVRS